MLGYTLSALVRWLTVAAIITVVAVLARMEVHGSGVDLVGLYTLALLLNLPGSCGRPGSR